MTRQSVDKSKFTPSDEWYVKAYKCVIKIAKKYRLFTADDIWSAGLEKPREPRVLGPVLRKISKEGLIRKSTIYKESRRNTRHGAPIVIWISKIKQKK